MNAEELKAERDRLVAELVKHYEATDIIRKKIGEIDTKLKNLR